MIIGGGNDGYSRQFQPRDHIGFGFENHTTIHRFALIGKRRFEVHEGDVRSGQQWGQFAQRPRRVLFLAGHLAYEAAQHDVASEEEPGFGCGSVHRRGGEQGKQRTPRRHGISVRPI